MHIVAIRLHIHYKDDIGLGGAILIEIGLMTNLEYLDLRK